MDDKVWFLLVDTVHDNQPIGAPFQVVMYDHDEVEDLRDRVKQECSISLENFDSSDLVIWQSKKPRLFGDADKEELERLVKDIDFLDKTKGCKLWPEKLMISTEILKDEILLVQVPYVPGRRY